MSASSFDAAYRAISEALTVAGAVSYRSLESSRIFAPIVAGTAEKIAAAVRERKRCFVFLGRPSSIDTTTEVGPVKRYALQIKIMRYYWCGKEIFSSEYESAALEAMNDAHAIRDALCWPGNLALDSSGAETGLDGGCLYGAGHTSEGPDRIPRPDGAGVVLQMIDNYRATIEIAAQTVS